MTCIGHGLTPDTHAQAMVLDCLRIFTNLRDGREPLTGVAPTQISLFVRENLP